MMKILLCILALSICRISLPAEDQPVLVKKDEVVIQVKGIVCSFCAYGAEKKLSKLDFINKKIYGDGVLIDINKHRTTVAIDTTKTVDLSAIDMAIRDGGYDPIVFYIQVTGQIIVKDTLYTLVDSNNKTSYSLTGVKVGNLIHLKNYTLQLKINAKSVKNHKRGAILQASVDDIQLVTVAEVPEKTTEIIEKVEKNEGE